MAKPLQLTTPGLGAAQRRARSRWRGPTRVLAIALLAVGALALADAAVTVLWQEPFSALYASLRQSHLSGDLRRVEAARPTPLEVRRLASIADEQRRIAFLARELERHALDGSAVGRIVIPRLGASFVVVKGTDPGALESGPGVYPETGFPGTGGTTAIAGHRTTYLAPFRHIDSLAPGNTIRLRMPYGEFTYTVTGQRVVSPTDVSAAVSEVGYPRLVLSACTPLFSAAKRLLVYARLTRTVPRGPALVLPDGALPRPIESSRAKRPARRKLPPVLVPFGASHELPGPI